MWGKFDHEDIYANLVQDWSSNSFHFIGAKIAKISNQIKAYNSIEKTMSVVMYSTIKANMLIAITMKVARYPLTARCTYDNFHNCCKWHTGRDLLKKPCKSRQYIGIVSTMISNHESFMDLDMHIQWIMIQGLSLIQKPGQYHILHCYIVYWVKLCFIIKTKLQYIFHGHDWLVMVTLYLKSINTRI